jgi:hypothetical protein
LPDSKRPDGYGYTVQRECHGVAAKSAARCHVIVIGTKKDDPVSSANLDFLFATSPPVHFKNVEDSVKFRVRQYFRIISGYFAFCFGDSVVEAYFCNPLIK